MRADIISFQYSKFLFRVFTAVSVIAFDIWSKLGTLSSAWCYFYTRDAFFVWDDFNFLCCCCCCFAAAAVAVVSGLDRLKQRKKGFCIIRYVVEGNFLCISTFAFGLESSTMGSSLLLANGTSFAHLFRSKSRHFFLLIAWKASLGHLRVMILNVIWRGTNFAFLLF